MQSDDKYYFCFLCLTFIECAFIDNNIYYWLVKYLFIRIDFSAFIKSFKLLFNVDTY